ncbi:MAG: hypothetical protein BWK72_13870 [Rhodoferax ferrireducens]|uniref:Uncharacterized protein n=1 Tax=Rhodoferax ferrireducens TaxID=192843 RepID=A0A1W9KSE0_9BURK|nr:MAG: hypothetical protein BWK72_13870 [Rhodoferax ferrireducens]
MKTASFTGMLVIFSRKLNAMCDVQSLHSKNLALGFTPIFIVIQKNRINSPLELNRLMRLLFQNKMPLWKKA